MSIKEKKYVIIAGYASTFNTIDNSHHIVKREAIDCKKFPDKVPILFQHDFKRRLGTLLNARTDKYGLYIEATFDLNNQLQKQVYKLIKDKRVEGMSVGLRIIESQYAKGVLVIQKAKLVEISLTSYPVNESCKIEFCESLQLYN